MIIAPTPIDALPPAPDPTQPQEPFDSAAYAWSDALPDFVTQANAIAVNVNNNATEAGGSAVSAAAARVQTGLDAAATSADRVQTGLDRAATSSDRTQTGLDRVATAADRVQTGLDAAAASASETKAGEWAEKATEVEAGKFSAKYWAIQAATAVSDGVIDDDVTNPGKTWSSQKISEQGILVLTYDNRATLRSTPAIAGKQSIVDGLGLFVHHVGSDEPDDDESCFATATGRWLLQQPHPDLLAAWALPDDEVVTDSASVTRRILTASAPCALTTIAAVSKASFTAAVSGAKTGAAAFATPLADLDARLAVSASVTAADTVTVTLNNPSNAASAANGIPAAWQIFVFNQE